MIASLGFASPADLYRYVGGTFEDALRDDVLGPELRRTGVTLKVVTTDPDAVLVLDLANARVGLGSEADAADTTIRMTSETANRFWQGKANLPIALARGQVRVEGRIASLLKLVPPTRQLIPAYVERLRLDGRTDLLADD